MNVQACETMYYKYYKVEVHSLLLLKVVLELGLNWRAAFLDICAYICGNVGSLSSTSTIPLIIAKHHRPLTPLRRCRCICVGALLCLLCVVNFTLCVAYI